ncbi:alpha/beta fold hydrolase [Aeromicrobium ginsengisoli]|uniref:Alpha/beta hydrolase n=1 Tax=Aeromicrobium ginsengisoli TaxID=363867 RepID=A0A5M4FBH0_9ACTN|nr:alpha/beta hydrolase [Aeromicrobium ginsengisoli]KAA1395645.1 alpha/beta hydrolase [Aeromicrobium ginsengisoli]
MTTRLAHTRKGSGEPLLLIHGIGHRRQAWDPVLDRLAESYDVIAIDLAGFGESEPYPAGTAYTMDNACRIIGENLEEWGVSQPHVVGNSLGGAIALEMGARGMARSVTALSPAGFFRNVGDRLVALFALILLKLSSYLPLAVVRPALRSAAGRRLIGRTLYVNGDRIPVEDFVGDALALRNGSAFFPTFRAGFTYRFTSKVDVPTTIAWATRDQVLVYGQSGLAQEVLPDARHVALPHCGHVPMVDDPELIVRVIDTTVAEASESEEQAA